MYKLNFVERMWRNQQVENTSGKNKTRTRKRKPKRKPTAVCKTLLTCVLLMTLLTNANALTTWSESITLQNGANITDNIQINKHPDYDLYPSIIVPYGATATISGNILNSGSADVIIKKGGGTLIITSSSGNTFIGRVNVQEGTLQLGNGTTTGNLPNVTQIISYSVNGTLTFNPGSTPLTFNCQITGSINVAKLGNGTVILTHNNNNYTGTTYVHGGILQFGNGTNGNINDNMDHIEFYGGTVRFEPNTHATFSKRIWGNGNVVVKGDASKVLTFTGLNAYNGTTIEAGSYLTIGTGTPQGTGYGTIVNHGTLTFDHSDSKSQTGAITGTGNLVKSGMGRVWLDGGNTYSGTTTINGGTLELVDGGRISSSSSVILNGACTLSLVSRGVTGLTFRVKHLNSNSATAVVNLNNNTLIFGYPGMNFGDCTFAGSIIGTGGITKTGTQRLFLTGTNTFSGTTKIDEGTLHIGNNTAAGSISGNIINNAYLFFNRSNAYTYSGVISGTGMLCKECSAVLTLSGANTYSGKTQIVDGTLALSGSIANSASVSLTSNTAKFSISGNKTIKGLEAGSSCPNAEVILGANTLTINNAGSFLSAAEDFSYAGIFSGTGASGLVKNGAGKLTLSGVSTATGTLTHSAGWIIMTNGSKWNGSYTKANTTHLEIKGNVTIQGALNLSGGYLYMNLNTFPASVLTVNGALSKSGTNTLSVSTSKTETNTLLIQANSGLSNTSNFAVANIAGQTPSLSVSNNRLLLSVIPTDNVPPTVSNKQIYASGIRNEAIKLGWTKATDLTTGGLPGTPQADLKYHVYQSLNGILGTPGLCETNGTLITTGINIDTVIITYNFNTYTNYYFNVVVEDLNGNKTAYDVRNYAFYPPALDGKATIIGDAAFGNTLMVELDSLTTYSPFIPNHDIGAITYEWRRGGSNILELGSVSVIVEANNMYYTVTEADIDSTLIVIILADNCSYGLVSILVTATKASQYAPEAPMCELKDDTMILLYEIPGAEYRINGGAWQTSPLFTGLTDNTTYQFEAYFAETATHFASPVSEKATITAGGGDPPYITSLFLPDGEVGTPYAETLTAYAYKDSAIVWSIFSGSLPNGLTLQGDLISGTPTAEGTFDFIIKAANAFGFDTLSLSITITDGTGIAQWRIENGELKIYPNPVSGQLQVTSYELQENSIVEIYDAVGQCVFTTPSFGHPSKGGEYSTSAQFPSFGGAGVVIDVSHLASGMYFLKVDNKVVKFVKE